jgi:hypothetical protein
MPCCVGKWLHQPVENLFFEREVLTLGAGLLSRKAWRRKARREIGFERNLGPVSPTKTRPGPCFWQQVLKLESCDSGWRALV